MNLDTLLKDNFLIENPVLRFKLILLFREMLLEILNIEHLKSTHLKRETIDRIMALTESKGGE